MRSLSLAPRKMLPEPNISNRSQRVRADVVQSDGLRQVKIRLETFDDKLGWYSSGSVTLGMEQLPLLEQAIAEMRSFERNRTAHVCEIIPFPTLSEEPESLPVAK